MENEELTTEAPSPEQTEEPTTDPNYNSMTTNLNTDDKTSTPLSTDDVTMTIGPSPVGRSAPVGVIVGVICGVCVVLLLTVVCVVIVMMRRRKLSWKPVVEQSQTDSVVSFHSKVYNEGRH